MSIVNPSTSFSMLAKVNDTPVLFLLDTGSVLTILRGSGVDHLCSEWNHGIRKSWLVPRVLCWWASIEIDIQGEKFSHSTEIVDPLTTEAILGLDILHCVVDLSHEQFSNHRCWSCHDLVL